MTLSPLGDMTTEVNLPRGIRIWKRFAAFEFLSPPGEESVNFHVVTVSEVEG